MNKIAKGYRLTVTSWENDADNYMTNTIEGYTLPQVKLMIELCQMMESRSNDTTKFGNMLEPSRAERALYARAIHDIVSKHPEEARSDSMKHAMLNPDPAYLMDVVNDDFYSLLGSSECFYTRVYESHKVEFIPGDILIEDVTRTLHTLTE